MKEPRPPGNFQYRIGLYAAGVILIHIVLCLVFACISSGRLSKTLPGVFYRSLVLAGPFFEESVIQTSDRFYYRYKPVNGTWSEFQENSATQFAAYSQQPWRYDELVRGDYIRRQAYNLERFLKRHIMHPGKAPASLQKINRYILHRAGTLAIDSVFIASVRNTHDLASGTTRADTLYYFTYSPNSLGPYR